ncbi:hypothetical protein PILCRDRAFT_830189 [Piloderma croceum F 1598]|uniref:Methyltransferase domain-containing protein n=1 Tax=Piloderma croceum (strain F 1598) TaxID=765440 RepID=A0A0C3EV64_PILCF|nr:hypothetical protein PILCRDRAFT_830189 [Piloderma croceum F 1598]
MNYPLDPENFPKEDADSESVYTCLSSNPFQSYASSRTSVSDRSSDRSSSPTLSVISITSSVREQAIANEHGRGINTHSEIYRLPADAEEVERLNVQHAMLKEIMGKYPRPLAEVLVDDIPGEPKTILDLGCGSGSWIFEAAADFPHCELVAVDLVPLQNLGMPSNCRSERDDINLGLEHYYGSFNFVHTRLICTGIKDYARLIDQISQVLRPGGLVEMLEFGFQLYDRNKQLVTVSLGSYEPPWFPRFMALICIAVSVRGGCLDASGKLYSWVKEIPAFTDIVHTRHWVPWSPWLEGTDPETKRLNALGALMSEDIKQFLKSGRPLLLGSGLPESHIDELTLRCLREIEEGRTPYYILLEHVYARHR